MKVFPTRYSWNASSHVFSVAPDIRQRPCIQAEFGSILHLLPLPIRSDTGCWLSFFTSCHSSLVWHHLPPNASLPLTVAATARPCGVTLHGWMEEKAKRKTRDVCVVCISYCNSALMSVQYISLLTFQHVWLWESYLWASAKFTVFSRRSHSLK